MLKKCYKNNCIFWRDLGKAGLSMSLRDLKNWKLEHYQGLFCLIEPGETEKEPTCILPAGP